MKNHPALARAALTLALFALALCVLHLGRSREWDGGWRLDEAEWLHISSAHWAQATGSGDPWRGLGPDDPGVHPWLAGIHESTFGAMNPGLSKLALGATLAAAGHREWNANIFPRFSKGLPQEQAAARRRAARELTEPVRGLGRWTVTVLSAGCAVLLYWIGARLGGPLAGGVALVLWLASPLVLDLSSHVRTDLYPVLFSLAALLAALLLAPRLAGARGLRSALAAAALLGLLAGLAVGAKLNGSLAALCVGAWIAAAFAWGRRGAEPVLSWRGLAASWAVAGAVCCGVFWLCSPALWGSPAHALRTQARILERWQGDIGLQQRQQRDSRRVARTLGQKLELGAWGVREYDPLRQRVGPAVLIAVSGLGLVALVLALRRRAGGRDATLVLIYLAVMVAGTTWFLPLDRSRYYVPYVPCLILCQAALVASLARLGRARLAADPP